MYSLKEYEETGGIKAGFFAVTSGFASDHEELDADLLSKNRLAMRANIG